MGLVSAAAPSVPAQAAPGAQSQAAQAEMDVSAELATLGLSQGNKIKVLLFWHGSGCN